mmetsp:Transcript_12183/g.13895  ORF Transcript_12183/g.13895 Transcript_12183/m.13895 type:complete len:201 (-) Transcript_12183:56-658(-)
MSDVIPKEVITKAFKGEFFHCKYIHDNTCEYDAFVRFFGVIKNSMKFYIPIHLIPVIIFKLKKMRKEPLKVLYGFVKNVTRSCLFLATYMTLLKYGLCFFKNLIGVNRPLNVILAGLWTFPGMFWEADGRRTEMGLYFLSPFIEGIWKWFDKRGMVTPIKNGDVYLFAITMGIIMYCYQMEPTTIKNTYLSLCKKLWGEN